MKRIQIVNVALLAAAGVLLTAACSSKPQPVAAPQANAVAANPDPMPVSDPAPPVQAELEARPEGRVGIDEMNRTGYLKDAFFDYNRYEIRPDQRETLARDADWLK